MSDEIVRDHRTEQCRSDYILIDWLRPIITAMFGESFGDLFQRSRKLRLSVLVAFLGRFRWQRRFVSTPQPVLWLLFVDLVCRGIRAARFMAAAVLATPSRRPSLDY